MDIDLVEKTLAEQGWVVIDAPQSSPISRVSEFLLQQLRLRLPRLDRLENYHNHIGSDDEHVFVVHELATTSWNAAVFHQIIRANLQLFRRLVGSDLHIQSCPYLRVVRPNTPGDAVPLHRDTYYGASPFEVSVVVPFTEMDSRNALHVVPRSHLEPDAAYPFTQATSPDVTIKSKKHQLGFPYAPRILDTEAQSFSEPVPLKVGQMMLFPLQLVHGGGSNTALHTRFSVDIRLANSLAPVQWSRGVRDDYFIPLCSTAVARSARAFLAANSAAEASA